MSFITRNSLAAYNTVKRILGKDAIGCLRYTVTWRCNSKCESCDIWNKSTGEKDLTPAEVDAFLKSPLLRSVRRIILSGGEPFLREDLPELVTVLHRNLPQATFGMTLNGLLPERTEKLLRQILKENPNIKILNAAISLNGPQDIHDRSRGIPGAFDRAIETYDRIRALVPTRFSFTFLPYNIDHFKWTRDFAEQKGTKAYLCWTVMNERFLASEKDFRLSPEHLAEHLKEYLSEQNWGTRVLRTYLYEHFLAREFIQCLAARQFLHLDPEGNVFPCNFKLDPARIMGNIKTQSLDAIWNTPHRCKILSEIDKGECLYPNGPCGDSDLMYSVRNNLLEVAGWYCKRPFRARRVKPN